MNSWSVSTKFDMAWHVLSICEVLESRWLGRREKAARFPGFAGSGTQWLSDIRVSIAEGNPELLVLMGSAPHRAVSL